MGLSVRVKYGPKLGPKNDTQTRAGGLLQYLCSYDSSAICNEDQRKTVTPYLNQQDHLLSSTTTQSSPRLIHVALEAFTPIIHVAKRLSTRCVYVSGGITIAIRRAANVSGCLRLVPMHLPPEATAIAIRHSDGADTIRPTRVAKPNCGSLAMGQTEAMNGGHEQHSV
jgi:hypothetical protein